MRLWRVMTAVGLVVFLAQSSARAQSISATEAKNYVGKTTTVRGVVASATYAAKTKGSPTFLDLDIKYPDSVFCIVIWGANRPKFPKPPETYYQGKTIKVTGRIKMYKGNPEMEVTDPSQIIVEKE